MDKKKIGAFLKKLRKEKDLTQTEFACAFSKECFCKIGLISDAAVSKWERGESLPNIEDLEKLAHFYGVTIDEILDGERNEAINLDKKYFISNPHWGMDAPKEVNLYEIREMQELEIETRFKLLLRKIISDRLTLSENAEFDYLLENFYSICIDDEFDDITTLIKNVKFQIIKTVSLMHNSTLDEKFWEVYKLFECNFMQTIRRDVCDDIEDAENILRKRINNLEIFEKDMLLAAIQVENVTNSYGIQDKELAPFVDNSPNLYERTYNRSYNEELLTKNAIKLLVECGARINPLLLGYQRDKIVKIDILERLIQLYNKFKKPLIIPVFEDQVYSFFEVENTSANRKRKYSGSVDEVLDETEYSDLERRLYNGERTMDKVISEWVGGNNEDEMIRYMWSVICELSLKDYIVARDKQLTQELIDRIDKLSLEDIRHIYFDRRQRV